MTAEAAKIDIFTEQITKEITETLPELEAQLTEIDESIRKILAVVRKYLPTAKLAHQKKYYDLYFEYGNESFSIEIDPINQVDLYQHPG